jgi:hypothetical protein
MPDLQTATGVGATAALSLRVSVATLVRVILRHPETGELILALERKATLVEERGNSTVEVIAQPFGGAIRIRDLSVLRDRIGKFHFDSEESRLARDFRIFIPPTSWNAVQAFWLGHLLQDADAIIETDPRRELAEEFSEAMGISLRSDQYDLTPQGLVIEDNPTPTANFHNRNRPTVRIYRVFDARITDSSLSRTMVTISKEVSDQDLYRSVVEKAMSGEKGRQNSVLAVPLDALCKIYWALPEAARDERIFFHHHKLDETVAAVLSGMPVPRYRRL